MELKTFLVLSVLTHRGTCRHHALLLDSCTDVGMVLFGQAVLHELHDLFLVYQRKGHHVHPEVRALAGPRNLLEGHVRVGIFLRNKHTRSEHGTLPGMKTVAMASSKNVCINHRDPLEPSYSADA